MAVSLDEGDYALQQENSRKIVFQLKLTDSSLRAIESLGDSSSVSWYLLMIVLIYFIGYYIIANFISGFT